MSEIDVFVELMDKNKIDMFLKMFKEDYRKGNVELRKLKLKKQLKSQNNKNYSLFKVLNYYKQDGVEKLTEEEFFKERYNLNTKFLTEDMKFANALIYFPDKCRELLPTFEKNIKDKKPIFYNVYPLNSEEEVEKYFLSNFAIEEEELDAHIENLCKYFYTSEKGEKIIKIREEMKKLSLEEFYDFFTSNMVKYSKDLILFIYVTSAKIDTKLKKGIYRWLIKENYYNLRLRETSLRNEENKIIEKVKTFEEEIKELKEQLHKTKEVNKKLSDENKKLKGFNIEFSNRVKEKEIEIEEMEGSYKENIDTLLEETKEIKLKYNDWSKELTLFACGNEELAENIIVVTNNKVSLLKYMFPEVKFYSSREIEKINFKKRHIKKVYIHRNSLESKEIFSLQNFLEEKDISGEIFIATNEREFMEYVFKLKESYWEELI